MAEGSQFDMAPDAAMNPVQEGTLLLSGEVTYMGKGHQLCLVQTGLRLVAPHAQDQDKAAGALRVSHSPLDRWLWSKLYLLLLVDAFHYHAIFHLLI